MDGIHKRDEDTTAQPLGLDRTRDPRLARRLRTLQSSESSGADTALALVLLREISASAYLMDPDGRVTQVNPAGLEQSGVAHLGDARGRCLWDLWPDAVEAALSEALADAAEGEASELTVRCPTKGGGRADCRVRLLPIEDDDGRVSKILAIARPV